TTTSWPCSTNSRTPDGVSATRYSSVFISVGTPTFTLSRLSLSWGSLHELAAPQGEPEVDPVARRVERPPGQLLDAADPVAQRVAVAVELARGALPLAGAPYERLGGAQPLALRGR